MKLREYAKRYIAQNTDWWKHSTTATYQGIYDVYVKDSDLGAMHMDEIGKYEIIEFFKPLIEKLSISRVRMVRCFLRSVFQDAEENDETENNPVDKAGDTIAKRLRKEKKIQDEEKVKEEAYTLDEIERCLVCVDIHYRPLFETLAWSGMRPNEAAALRWEDIDFKKGLINISKGRVMGVENRTKSGKSRKVPLHPRVKNFLSKLLKSNEGAEPTDHVFSNKSGEPLALGVNFNLPHEWAKAEKIAGVPHRRPYMLRHSIASLCAREGMDDTTLAAMLGHASITTTQRFYRKATADTLNQMSEQLNKIGKKGEEDKCHLKF